MHPLPQKILSTGPVKRAAAALLARKGAPLHLSCVIHSEAVQDKAVFDRLLSFAKGLDFKPALCVMTPRNPYIRRDMQLRDVGEAEFISRLRELAQYCEIGLHGHWCRPRPAGAPESFFKPGRPTRVEQAGFDLTLGDQPAVERQFIEEHSWLAANFGAPRVYSAGWWFLDAGLRLLDSLGFDADCSFRYGQPDSFGQESPLTAESLPPRGRPFGLPPSGRVVELPSLDYIHLNWWSAAKSARPLLRGPEGPLFASFPVHDYNLLDDGGRTAENIGLLAGFGNVRWLAASAAAALAREEIKK